VATLAAKNSVPVAVRVPNVVADRLDSLAERSGLSRAQLLRFVLANVRDEDIPRPFFEAANDLRATRIRV
jgi:predicted DNA-binding protein